MRSDSIAAAAAVFAAAALSVSSAVAHAQAASGLIEAVDVSDAERNVNIVVQFSCSVRYLTHAPADRGGGVAVRLRPGGDCVSQSVGAASERPVIGGSSSFVTGVRLESIVPGEVALTLEWAREAHFVTVPTSDGRGIRIRILDAGPARRGAVTVAQPTEPPSGYAVNLESSKTEFTPAQIESSAALLRTPTHVSTIELEGVIWYRLRAGPIAARRDAERLLAVAQQTYPRAWLGVNDEPAPASVDAVPVASSIQPTLPVDPPMPERERQTLMSAARKGMAKREYPRAIELLTKLTRQPEYPGRERAQEMLGLARERSGQLAHAKAEYEEYLRRYPEGGAAPRLRSRLRALASATRAGRGGTLGGTGEEEGGWMIAGGASQIYRWENFELDAPDASTQIDSQNALYTDGDLIARKRGDRFDLISRVTAGYARNLLTDGPGDQVRVSSAFFEINDRERGLAGRLGRQSRNDSGLLGTFDGFFASYQLRPGLAINASAGMPVESTRDGTQSDRRFVGLSADFGPFDDKWDVGVFVVAQQYAGETDRRAAGVEARYFVPGRTVVALVDYDFYFQQLNSAVLMGSFQLPARWVASFNLDHRLTPVLTTRNALIGQPVLTLEELLRSFSADEVYELARDRTPLSDLYSVSLTKPLSQRFQLVLDAYGSRSDSTPASGGVPEIPESSLHQAFQVQLIGSSVVRSSDLFAILARYEKSDTVTLESAGIVARLPLWGAWRIGPRLRVDRRTLALDAAEELVYVPTLRIDYQRRNTWFELEMSAELGQRDLPAESESWQRMYVGIGYRLSF